MEQDLRKQKQKFLLEEVINKNYDPNRFFVFINQIKEDGSNVDTWTLEELQKVVKEFVMSYDQYNQEYDNEEKFKSQLKISKSYSRSSQNKQEIYEQEGINSDEQIGEKKTYVSDVQPFSPEKKSIENNQNFQVEQPKQNSLESTERKSQDKETKQGNNLPQLSLKQKESSVVMQQHQQNGGFEFLEENQHYSTTKESMQEVYMKSQGVEESFLSKTIKCQKMNVTIPVYNKVKIIVTDPQKQVGYLFGLTGSYILYKIITKPYNWDVQRRMTDFQALRTVLQKLFPGKLIPPLDPNLRENNEHEITKRVKFLNNFLNDLRHSPCIWYHPYTISFFSDPRDKWEQTLKQFDKEKENEKISMNLSGEIQIRFCNENYEYKEELNRFVNKSEANYHKLYTTSKQLKIDFQNVANTLKEFSNTYFALFQDINEFNGKIVEGQVHHKKLGDSYYIYGQIFDSWSKYMNKSIQEISNLTNEYKYSYQETKVQRELYKECVNAENIFIKYQQVYQEKNGEQHKNQKKDNQEVQYYSQLKSDYAYYLTQLCQESQKIYEKKGEDNIRFLNYMGKAEASKINELCKVWSELIQSYVKSPFPIPRESLRLNSSGAKHG